MAGAIHADPGFVPVQGHLPARRFGMRCPHCKSIPDIRTSEEQGPTIRVIYFACRNPACGHCWRASLIYDVGLSPSAIPDPALNLPMRPVPRAAVLRAIADASARPDPDQPGLFDPSAQEPAS